MKTTKNQETQTTTLAGECEYESGGNGRILFPRNDWRPIARGRNTRRCRGTTVQTPKKWVQDSSGVQGKKIDNEDIQRDGDIDEITWVDHGTPDLKITDEDILEVMNGDGIAWVDHLIQDMGINDEQPKETKEKQQRRKRKKPSMEELFGSDSDEPRQGPNRPKITATLRHLQGGEWTSTAGPRK